MEAARRRLLELGIPCYPSAERAVAALKALHDYSAWRSRPPRVVTRFPVNRRRVERVIRWHERMGQKQVGEVEAKEILRAYEFHVLDGQLVDVVAPFDAHVGLHHIDGAEAARRGPGGPVQNVALPQDVNDDGFVTPIDALLVIHYLNNPPMDEGEAEGEAGSELSLETSSTVASRSALAGTFRSVPIERRSSPSNRQSAAMRRTPPFIVATECSLNLKGRRLFKFLEMRIKHRRQHHCHGFNLGRIMIRVL